MLTYLLSIPLWLICVEIINFSLLPLWSRAFNKSPEEILSLSRVLSFFTFNWLSWILSEYAYLPYTTSTQLLVLCCLFLTGHFILRLEWPSWRFYLFNLKKSDYLSYISCLFLILLYRFYNSEITWGEKPLEFSLFNYFSRETILPAEHPWAAGEYMSYYYLGFYGLGILQKLSGLDPSVGFNLSIAFIGSILFCCYENLFRLTGISRIKSILFACLLVFGASLNPVYIVLDKGSEINFDLFWASSRNFTSPAFAEYPVWSLLFADLHAHVIAMPLVIAIIAVSWICLSGKNYFNFIICGFLWGLLYSVNGWDFVSLAICLALIISIHSLYNFNTYSMLRLCLRGFAVSAGAIISFLPFRLSQKHIYSSGWNWVVASEFNKIEHIALHFGTFIGIVICCLAGLIILKPDRKIRLKLIPSISVLIPVLIVILSYLNSEQGQPWIISVACSLLILLACYKYLGTESDKTAGFAFCLIVAACSLISITECIYLIDRMNTIFKGYQLIWPTIGIAACLYLNSLDTNLRTKISDLRISIAHIFYATCYIFIGISIVGSLIDIKAMLSTKRSSNNNYSLIGDSYLDNDDPDEASLIRWIQHNVKDKAYIIEAAGPGYQEFSRVVMHTGLPSLIGWEHHTKQGGVDETEVKNRVNDLEEIYNTENVQRADSLLRYYGIDLIFVGKLEQQNYNSRGLSKFAENPDFFIPLVASGKYVLYLTKFSPLNFNKNEQQQSSKQDI